jgi:hypothetical protein
MNPNLLSQPADLWQTSLVDLLERVCRAGDLVALKEILENRSPFGLNGGKPLRLVEFVKRLREDRQKRRF